jgi:hypothetical protein
MNLKRTCLKPLLWWLGFVEMLNASSHDRNESLQYPSNIQSRILSCIRIRGMTVAICTIHID